MTEARRIAVVTSTRADYGLLRWTMSALKNDPRAQLQVIATGTHLSRAFGYTIDEIREDGFAVDAEIEMDVETEDGFAAASAAGVMMSRLAKVLFELRPDLMLVLGDRYEILAAAQAAHISRTPIAHLHGGEVTTGSFDDGARHAITKLARLHLTSTKEHRRRVLQLGEDPAWVHVVGAPGLENLERLAKDDRAAFERRVGLELGRPAMLLTYHPATAANEEPEATTEAILDALARLPQASIIATGSNADPGARAVMAKLRDEASKFGGRLVIHESLGQQGYVSALFHCDVIVGNSSSGMIEAPSAGIPTVNVGSRQDGRPRAASVIDCGTAAGDIHAAITRALTEEVRATARCKQNPYAGADLNIAARIAELLLGADMAGLRADKPFIDLPNASAH